MTLFMMLLVSGITYAVSGFSPFFWTTTPQEKQSENSENSENSDDPGHSESSDYSDYLSPEPPDTIHQYKVRLTDQPGDDNGEYPFDLENPENLKYGQADYDEKSGFYKVGSKLGDNYLSAPYLMTPQEYLRWSERRSMNAYFRQRNDSLFVNNGKEKFDFTDMHFDLGPAEKIFGPGGVRVKTQGSAEIQMGFDYSYTDNPSLSERNRKQTNFNFDEKVNLSVNASVGDKMKFNLNYNTDATFDFDAKNLKLAYEGKEDEIVKLIEAGNISMPTNSSLVRGASSLFGVRTDLQFGKLNLQMVVSQKKTKSRSVSAQGGDQMRDFEIQVFDYDENRHFFLAQFFRDNYDRACASLPNITSGVTINRVEIWVTNTTGVTENTRNIVGFVDLAEHDHISNSQWTPQGGSSVPYNKANTLYTTLVGSLSSARVSDQTSTTLDGIMTGGVDYEKVENARLLNSSEYTLNTHLGYVSLNNTLQTAQVLAVAFEYTYGGQTYQVGEFSKDITNNEQALFVKLLKNTSNSPRMGNWNLMMKNVYNLGATNVQRQKFELDVKYLSDTTGVYLSYLPAPQFKSTTLLKMLNLDRLDANDKPNPNGKFDYVEGYTVNSSRGYVIFPVVEPFGDWLRNSIGDDALANKYCYDELYDSTKTNARQITEKNMFILTGEYKGTNTSEIDLGSMNIPVGSVTVTAGGVTLTEGSDYTVDYSAGVVTIINQSILDAGTKVDVSLESQSDYSMIRKTLLGVNWQYDVTKNFQLGGTLMHLTEKAQTSKVAMGAEPLNNTLWGLNMNWKTQSQWLTNMIDKIPLINVTAPSSINLSAEFAQLIAGQAHGVQGNASYIDDFEETRSAISVKTPTEWMLSSTPSNLTYGTLKNDVKYGYNRALLAWYYIDPLFTRRSSALTPGHIKSDLDQLSNHYVREVYEREVYPNKDTNVGESTNLPILNMAFYPNERGPYNLDTDVDQNGHLNDPKKRWGGMMRKIDTNDFETANVQYIEFWMLDPFIYTGNDESYGGDLYIHLGDVSEDVLKDGKKSYESGLPVNAATTYTETLWGRVPNATSVVYSFSTESNARQRQDVGLNGLSDADEAGYGIYSDYLKALEGKVRAEVLDSIRKDPAGDDYHYFRGSDFDEQRTSVLDRYKHINGVEGNSPNSSDTGESYNTAYKSTPDCEDVNSDYTMNEYENFFEYKVSMRPSDLIVGRNHIVDRRVTKVKLRNGNTEEAIWYEFRIPVEDFQNTVGSISDFSSVRFMRMYMTGFEKPVVLRFASLDLVRGEWRNYKQTLYTGDKPSISGTLATAAVNIEENNDKTPVNYVLPPGISRVQDPSQPQLTQDNEQALSMTITNLATGDARAVYRTTKLDLRRYKHLQMFVHANALEGDEQLKDNDMSVFIRIGTDYRNNYYEYEIPLTLTQPGHYDTYSVAGCRAVWPTENMLDIDFATLTNLKKERNKAKAMGSASYTQLYYRYDDEKPSNKISIIGNPSLGEVKTMMIGVRNNSSRTGSVEVWVNELRMQDYNNEGGWAAQGNLDIQLSDIGMVNLSGHTETAGFGGIEQGVNERRDDDLYEWSVTTQFELGRLFPEKWRMQMPFYYSYSWQKISPKYNPFDTDMLLKDALESAESDAVRDSLKSITELITKNKNFSLSNWKSNYQSRHPLPFDPANFAFSYSYNQRYTEGQTTVYENEENWKFNFQYNYSPKYKTWEPFKKMKAKSKWWDIVKAQNLNYLPQNLSFNTDIMRSYYELQERDLDEGTRLPVNFSEQFLWNRDLSVRWDIFKSLKLSWTSATHAEIEEPYVVINKQLYPDEYAIWKDSVKHSIRNFGRPLTYASTFNASYQVPFNKIPALTWITADGSYSANYGWTRGMEMEDGSSLGHTVTSNRAINVNGRLNLEDLYNKSKFLKSANDRFSGSKKSTQNKAKTKTEAKPKQDPKSKDNGEGNPTDPDTKGKTPTAGGNKGSEPKKTKGFTKEIQLNDTAATTVAHGQKSKRLIVRATTKEGKSYKLKYRKVDENNIKILSRDTIPLKLSVVAKQPLDDLTWYKVAQVVARGFMSVRNASISYRNTYSLTLPGFNTEIGDAFGQKRVGGMLSPGLDFAFGNINDSYIQTAADRGWLLQNDSNVTTPATTAAAEDLAIKVSLEPLTNLKIDLDASRTTNKAKSIKFMYEGMPRTMTGSFSQTIISIKSAFATTGNIDNNYNSKPFNEFLANIPVVQQRIENKYKGSVYPQSAGPDFAGKQYDAENGSVNPYSADVLVPAFLAAYCGGDAKSRPLSIFPKLTSMLPNWRISYTGLVKLPWFSDHFKSFNINHQYKSVYSVGAYSSYSSFMEYMGEMGFIADVTTGNPIPNSMYDVSNVSINESFSPLIGVDMTFNNGITAKLEYKKIRTLNLSMTSVALTENSSNDITVGFGCKFKDLNLFGAKGIQDPSSKKSKKNAKGKKDTEENQQAQSSASSRNRRTISHDLNVNFEFSYRMQNALNRNIQTALTTATNGSTAYKIAMTASYTFSRLLTLSGFLDWQRNVPLVSSSSYPTTTADFGVSMKFSLTR